MLQAWISPRWAVSGGLLAILHPYLGIDSYWAQSYWGGALAATGGALVLGAVRSLLKEPQIHRALLTGAGLLILSNSRPYEGFLIAVCAAFALMVGLIRKGEIETNVLLRKIVLPLVLACTATGLWIGYYNFRLTGNMLRLPYQVHEAAYSVAPLFVWQESTSLPEYRHARIRDFHASYVPSHRAKKHSWMEFGKIHLKEWLLYSYVAGNMFLVPLIVNAQALARWTLRNPWARFGLITYSVVTVGLLTATYSELHYGAPIIALNYYFIVQGLRLWSKRDRQLKPFIVPVLLCLAVVLLIITSKRRIEGANNPLAPQAQRETLLAHLEKQSGKHVVLVTYGPEESLHYEWVYNEADIDQAKVVWARDMGQRENCRLVEYFKNHIIWSVVVEGENAPVKVRPLARESCMDD
jgi:hypothetical protein